MFFKFMGLFNVFFRFSLFQGFFMVIPTVKQDINQTPFHVKMNINAQYLLIYTYMFHAVKSIESI